MSAYTDVRQMAFILLNRQLEREDQSFTAGEVKSAVLKALSMLELNLDPEPLVADLESSFQTKIGQERILKSDEDWEPWLPDRKAEIKWQFWDRYRQYLALEKGWASATVDSLDRTTDNILGLLTNPVGGHAFNRRGMVVGHVQSGKTSNYTGLICKAADAGYRVIVVLTGFHNSLRTQTQIRLEEGFLGYVPGSSSSDGGGGVRPIGVGDPARFGKAPPVNAVTTREADFKRAAAKNFAIHPDSNPLLFVVKKNVSVLRNLLSWVSLVAKSQDESGRRYVTGVPLLVIDDEADQGSIDTKQGALDQSGDADPDHEPTALNRRIRKLLYMFDQSAYVGYTATPFANIFIHERPQTPSLGRDLFPSSFIVSLPTPSNYVGPSEVFGLEGSVGNGDPLPIIREVTDHASSLQLKESSGWIPPVHKQTHVPRFAGAEQVPPSLAKAIRSFILSCAARSERGDSTAHNSMLVHVTRFTRVQERVAEQIDRELRGIQRRLRHGDGDSPSNIMEELRNLWELDYEPTTQALRDGGRALDCRPLRWSEVKEHVLPAALSLSVKTINGLAGDVLDYETHSENGLNVIAVGGDKLSRGLTLEGLSVSYFVRSSRMYDTLMQMGRWFGYRPRYLDLCRLFTTPELSDWYAHIADASRELRDDFNLMAASGQTPKDFGHRVKSHPSLMVTSSVKMRHGTPLQVTFSGGVRQTIDFFRDRSNLEANWQAGKNFIEAIESQGCVPQPHPDSKQYEKAGYGRWLWANVESERIIDFLSEYKGHPASRLVRTKLFADYIAAENNKGRLRCWNVVLGSGEAEVNSQPVTVQMGCQAKSRLVNRAYKAADQDQQHRLASENHYRVGVLSSPSDLEPIGREEDGLIVLYPLYWGAESEGKVESDARHIPILGFAIKFPGVDGPNATTVEYIANNVYMDQEFFFDEP